MTFLSYEIQAEIIYSEVFNSTSRYLEALVKDTEYRFLSALQLNKLNIFEEEAQCLDLHFSINTNCYIQICDKRDEFVFDLVNVSFFFFFISSFPIQLLTRLKIFFFFFC